MYSNDARGQNAVLKGPAGIHRTSDRGGPSHIFQYFYVE